MQSKGLESEGFCSSGWVNEKREAGEEKHTTVIGKLFQYRVGCFKTLFVLLALVLDLWTLAGVCKVKGMDKESWVPNRQVEKVCLWRDDSPRARERACFLYLGVDDAWV